MGLELRDWQVSAYKLIKDNSGVVVALTGSGKTILGVKLVLDNLSGKTLIVVPTIALMKQWRDSLIKFGVPADSISLIGGGYKEYPDVVTVAVIDSLLNINLNSSMAVFDHCILDEVHRYASSGGVGFLRALQCSHRVGLTATFERPDGRHSLLESLVGPVVYRIDLGSDDGNRYVASYEVSNIPLRLSASDQDDYNIQNTVFLNLLPKFGYSLDKVFKDYRRNADARKCHRSMVDRKSIITNGVEKREEVLAQLDEQRTIIFDESQDNAKLVYDMIKAKGYSVGLYHSGLGKRNNMDTIKRFKSGEYQILVTVRALDEGLDVPNVSKAIIVNGNSTKRQFFQRLGRVLRKSGDKQAELINLFYDDTHEVGIIRKRMEYLK